MHHQARQSLYETIQSMVTTLPENPRLHDDRQLIWRRREDGAWDGKYETQAMLDFAWDRDIGWTTLAEPFQQALLNHHADHVGLVGTLITGSFQMSATELLRMVANELWRRHHSFRVNERAIGDICSEVEAFFDSQAVQLNHRTPRQF